jgi:hypothetical protein
MQSENKNQSRPSTETKNENEQYGSSITDPEEKELRKMDDWHSHTHEKHRDLKDPYRASELHGVVGKEIKEEITREQYENEQQLLDEKKKRKSKSPNKNLNKGGLNQSKQESKTTNSGQ